MSRLFYYDGNYCRLDGSSLTSLTATETEVYCRSTRGVTLLAFLHPDEVRATHDLFWKDSDMITENIRFDENFASTITVLRFDDRLLSAASYALVKAWLLAADPTLIDFTVQIPD
jgi:hypothetical protein